jgi:hypothetical protein
MGVTRPDHAWERYAWPAGVLFVAALGIEFGISFGVGVNADDSVATITRALADHESRLVAIACLSVVYAVAFPVYLCGLHQLLRRSTSGDGILGPLMLIGGTVLVVLHAIGDIGITGAMGAKLGSFGLQHDPGASYTLYILLFAVQSVGDVFGSLFAFATGLLVLRSGALPRWLGWLLLLAGVLLFLQGFGLGGVIGTFGLVLDGIGFVLFLVFVLASSVILLTRQDPVPAA